MKRQILVFSLLMLAALASACANRSLAAAPAATAEPGSVQDKATFVTALEALDATVESGEPITQAFFTPEGSILKINGTDVQVFEYESVEAMEGEASQVTPDGGSIGTSMVTWVDTPHFYKAGRIIVLYVGSDQTVLDLLGKALGQQFAGR
ncbi:MAG TPA: hypothetical protein VFY83_16270 [Anaerolineales bacterium]|nr:hypothetical protein [Anaerolineales bacterium]